MNFERDNIERSYKLVLCKKYQHEFPPRNHAEPKKEYISNTCF